MTREWADARKAAKSALVERRKLWADCVNAALERNGLSERVSHLSNAERGLEEEPTRHLGTAPTRWSARRRGAPSATARSTPSSRASGARTRR